MLKIQDLICFIWSRFKVLAASDWMTGPEVEAEAIATFTALVQPISVSDDERANRWRRLLDPYNC